MILFITDRPQTYVPIDPKRFFRGAYHSYFFYQLYSNGIDHSEIKLLFTDQYNEKKLTDSIKVIVPLGIKAHKIFNQKISLDKARGSIFQETLNGLDLFVIPTFHPEELKLPYSLFMDSSIKKAYAFRKDIQKAKYTLDNGFEQPVERFNINPTLDDLKTFVDQAIENDYLLGTDIEATGLSIEYAQIVCIGFAYNESDCLVVPLTRENGLPYWKGEEQREVKELLNKLFNSCRFLFQNGVGYDVPLLRARGFDFPLTSFTDDTMLLHHVLNPEILHNIGMISSFYGQQPYWKADFLNKKVSIHRMDQTVMKTYNARDCVALHQIYWPMIDELKLKELEEVYKREMDLCPAVITMQETGVLMDESKQASWQRYLNKELKEKKSLIDSLKTLPSDFNYSSGDHLSWLFYGLEPPTFKNISKLKDYEKHYNYGYNCTTCNRKVNLKYHYKDKPFEKISKKCPKCKVEKTFALGDYPKKEAKPKSKTSDDYKKIKVLEKISKIKPLVSPKSFSPQTSKSGYKTDKVAIAKYIIALNKRLEELESLKRRTEHHAKENRDLTKTLKFLVNYQQYSALLTLKKSFYDMRYNSKGQRIQWRDGRLRPSLQIQGTSTGRFSCKDPNL